MPSPEAHGTPNWVRNWFAPFPAAMFTVGALGSYVIAQFSTGPLISSWAEADDYLALIRNSLIAGLLFGAGSVFAYLRPGLRFWARVWAVLAILCVLDAIFTGTIQVPITAALASYAAIFIFSPLGIVLAVGLLVARLLKRRKERTRQ